MPAALGHAGTRQDGGNTTRGGRGRDFGGWRARTRAHVLACGGGVCVRARDSVCYNIRVSLSWVLLQVPVLRQALDVALLKDWNRKEDRRLGWKKKQGITWEDLIPDELSSVFCLQQKQHAQQGSPCYTISYWLAVINRDRQHASSIPINCSRREEKQKRRSWVK